MTNQIQNSNFKDKLIAVVGVSSDPNKYSHRIFRDLVENGYDVVGINPKGEDVLGKHIYKKISEMPKTPDLVITVVPPTVTEQIVKECGDLGIKNVWMQPGSESQAAIAKAKGYGIGVVANACFMRTNKIWD